MGPAVQARAGWLLTTAIIATTTATTTIGATIGTNWLKGVGGTRSRRGAGGGDSCAGHEADQLLELVLDGGEIWCAGGGGSNNVWWIDGRGGKERWWCIVMHKGRNSVEETLGNKIRHHVDMIGLWSLMIEISGNRKCAEIGLGFTKMTS
jgi:hypothetical protein